MRQEAQLPPSTMAPLDAYAAADQSGPRLTGAESEMCAPQIEEGEARVLGYRMRYLAAGSGDPVLLLHGLADSGDTWLRVLPALARRYRVYAPDMLGCGASEKPRVSYSPWALATYLRHFLDAVGAGEAHVAGHSLGAGIALHLYIQYPERVRRLALLASGGMGRDLPLNLRLCTLAGSSSVISALLASRHTQHPAARLGHAVLGRLWPATSIADGASGASTTSITTRIADGAASAAMDSAALSAAEEAAILDRLREPAARHAFLEMLRSVGDMRGQRFSALDTLHLVRVPVLLIHGARDTVIPVAHGHAAHSRLQRSRLEVLDGCGHCPHREAPSRVSHLLGSFFAADAWPPDAQVVING